VIIRVENLKKVYDTGAIQVEALRDINLDIEKNEPVYLI
jgi:putative ABC transport system ATP-binding protein